MQSMQGHVCSTEPDRTLICCKVLTSISAVDINMIEDQIKSDFDELDTNNDNHLTMEEIMAIGVSSLQH